MEREVRAFKVKSHIIGGGLALRDGDIVDESQLRGYQEWLLREGGIEEVARPAVASDTPREKAYTA